MQNSLIAQPAERYFPTKETFECISKYIMARNHSNALFAARISHKNLHWKHMKTFIPIQSLMDVLFAARCLSKKEAETATSKLSIWIRKISSALTAMRGLAPKSMQRAMRAFIIHMSLTTSAYFVTENLLLKTVWQSTLNCLTTAKAAERQSLRMFLVDPYTCQWYVLTECCDNLGGWSLEFNLKKHLLCSMLSREMRLRQHLYYCTNKTRWMYRMLKWNLQ